MLASAAIIALAGPIAIGMVHAAAQSEATSRPTFEVASVKLHKDDGVGPRNSRTTWGPQGVDLERPLAFIISEAYHIPPGYIVGPSSLTKEALWGALSQGYDIVAKADHRVSRDQLRLMLQSLLADRFQLTMHRESKVRSVYRLVVAKGGPKLEDSEPVGDLVMSRTPEGFVYRHAEAFRICGLLSSHLDRMVVDETGLKGLYNFTVKLPEDLIRNALPKSDLPSPDSPTAGRFADVLKPLGLQLIAGTASVEYLVVDHVERPTEN